MQHAYYSASRIKLRIQHAVEQEGLPLYHALVSGKTLIFPRGLHDAIYLNPVVLNFGFVRDELP